MNDAAQEGRISTAARLLDAGNVTTAERLLREGLAYDPEHPRAHALMALIFYRKGWARDAVREANVAIGLAPTEEAFRFKALALNKLGYRGQAIEAAASAVSADPGSAPAALVQALAFENNKNAALAEAAYRRAAALDAVSGSFTGSLGLFLMRRGRLTEARGVAAALDPHVDAGAALLLKGEIALADGNAEDARQLALWLLNLNATDSSALRLLAKTKAHQSHIMGAWWRWSMFIGLKRPWERLLIASLGVILLLMAPFGLGFVFAAYLVVCRRVFQSMVTRELKVVRLRPQF